MVTPYIILFGFIFGVVILSVSYYFLQKAEKMEKRANTKMKSRKCGNCGKCGC